MQWCWMCQANVYKTNSKAHRFVSKKHRVGISQTAAASSNTSHVNNTISMSTQPAAAKLHNTVSTISITEQHDHIYEYELDGVKISFR